jgi:hypothetical protein
MRESIDEGQGQGAPRPRVHIAQVNIARAKAPVDSPLLDDFMAMLEPINRLADSAPGFVWRLQTDNGDATAIRVFDDDRIIVNVSVWESIDHLVDFVYRSQHVEVMRRRRQWFQRINQYMALWWIPPGHKPTVPEAEERLSYLRQHGPTPYAFTFTSRFSQSDRPVSDPLPRCPT